MPTTGPCREIDDGAQTRQHTVHRAPAVGVRAVSQVDAVLPRRAAREGHGRPVDLRVRHPCPPLPTLHLHVELQP
eukprot:3823714-Prymnesium_polylepis.1